MNQSTLFNPKRCFVCLIFLLGTIVGVRAKSVKIGNLYYNLNTTFRTAEVTDECSDYGSYNYASLPAEVVIPAEVTYDEVIYNVTSIGREAFYCCTSLTSITIPNSVKKIGYHAFYCTNLTSIVIEEGNSVYDSRNNCNGIIETKSNTLIQGSDRTIIPQGVTSIGNEAFYGYSNITSITIPNSVTSIGDQAFSYCSNITSVIIPNSVTNIGFMAFSDCTSLTSVIIPNKVTLIKSAAFTFCPSLTSITVKAITPPILLGEMGVNFDMPVYVPLKSI